MSRECVLMIEDDEEMIALGTLILEKENLVVLSATNGAAGLELARAHSPDLVLLDIMMDEMDGWEVLQAIKSDPELGDTPVVMLTARHNLEDEEETESYADQFSGYIVKPFIIRELVDEVKRVLDSQGRCDESA